MRAARRARSEESLPRARLVGPWIPAVVACLAIALALPLWAGPEAERARELERAGDVERAKAVPHYRRAFESWEKAAELARALGDDTTSHRAVVARVALSVNLLDPELLDGLGFQEEASPWPLAARRGSGAGAASLRNLGRLLDRASRAYPRLRWCERRDLLLIHETQALVERVLADSYQLAADDLYRRAYDLVAPAMSADPRAVAATVRLEFKLRQLPEAWSHARGTRADLSRLGPQAEREHLRIQRALARFLRKGERARVAGETCIVWERPRPAAPLHRFPASTQADLVATVSTFVDLLSGYRLSRREAVLCSYFGALSAIELGEYALAEELLRGRERSVGDDPWLQTFLLARLASARDRLGDYEGALRAARRSLSLASGLEGADPFRARLSLVAAQALLGLGRLREAANYPRQLVSQRDLPLELRLRARLLLGSCLFEEGREVPVRLDDALRAFSAAERELNGAPESDALPLELEVTTAIQIANVMWRQAVAARRSEEAGKKRREAIGRQDRALRRASEAGLRGLAATAAANLAELYLEDDNLGAARTFATWALGRARALRQFETEWRCHWYLARVADAAGAEELADREFDAAAGLVDSYRTRILDAETKSGFMSDKMDLYRQMVRRELGRERPARALDLAERCRARALVESLGWRFVTLASGRESRLYRDFVALMAREARWREGGNGSLLGVPATGVDYDTLRSRLRAMRDYLRSAPELGPVIRALVDGAPATTEEIQRQLGEKSTLLEYFSLGDSIALFVVERGAVQAVTLPVRPRDLRALLRRFVGGGASDAELSRRLYELLLKPVAALLGGRRLVIVPYGALHQLPFDALRRGNSFAVERWEIAYLPSASLLKYLRWNGDAAPKRGTAAGSLRLLALADPDTDYNGDGKRDMAELVNARREVASFAPSFARREILSGEEAREAALYRFSQGKEVIHFACHGEFYPTRPWDSTLFLARGSDRPGDDGLLRAFEVYGLDLRGNRLVNLSGCETGRSEVVGGDDPLGIATAFLHSGASSLLVSLWKVEDAATAALMKSFYRKWIVEGKEQAAALREAKLELVRGAYPDPRHWAAFVLIGGA